MLNRYRHTLVGVCAVFVSACQTTSPVEKAPAAAACPVVEIPECPVCNVTACPEQTRAPVPALECPAVPKDSCSQPERGSRYSVIGEKEWALVEPGDVVLEARIDTGAETSSIHAENIQLLEKDGARWVRFTITDPADQREIQLERRLHRRILIKQTGDENLERRYVVRMWVSLGNTRTWLDVSLSDRDDFEFPLLIGRNMLMDAFAVDVSLHHTLQKPAPETTEGSAL